MRPVARKAWLTALRSGEYRQARRKLCDAESGTMCCLGVLIDVAVDGEWVLDSYMGYYKFDGSLSALTPRLLNRLGLSMEDQRKLISLNDDSYCSFSAIADWVEANL